MQPDKRTIVRLERRPFGCDPIDRVRSIKNNHLDVVPFTGTQAKKHCPDKRVIARPDVLKIDKKCINILQHGRRWFPMFAIETEDRNAKARMLVALPLDHVVLSFAAIAMLRPE